MLHRTLATLAVLVVLSPALAAQGKSAKITVMLRGVLGDGSVKAYQKSLAGVKGIKFKASDIAKGKEPRFFSDPFVIEIADVKKTTLGAIAKTAIATKTPVQEDLSPGINLVVYSRDAISERTFVRVRDNLKNVKGIELGRGNMGAVSNDAYYWIRLDATGRARLNEIVAGIQQSGIKISLTNPLP